MKTKPSPFRAVYAASKDWLEIEKYELVHTPPAGYPEDAEFFKIGMGSGKLHPLFNAEVADCWVSGNTMYIKSY